MTNRQTPENSHQRSGWNSLSIFGKAFEKANDSRTEPHHAADASQPFSSVPGLGAIGGWLARLMVIVSALRMGIELHITVPHQLKDFSASTVAHTFHPLAEKFGHICRYYAARDVQLPSDDWARRDDADTNLITAAFRYPPAIFDAPAGFSFHLGPHAISIHHPTRLGLFCTEPEIRNLLRSLTLEVVHLASGERRAIYSPDDYGIYDLVFEGRTFSEIEARLLEAGLPASSFAELDARGPRPDHYFYIDRFDDLYERSRTR